MRKSRSFRKDTNPLALADPTEVETRRIARHEKLIKMVKDYRRTLEE